MKRYKKALFIFRRDLRLADNTGLLNALRQSKEVIPLFIIDPEQVGAHNPYRSLNAMQFMAQSLFELEQALKERESRLSVFFGKPSDIIATIIKKNKDIDAVFANYDYTPFAKKRDANIKDICSKPGIPFNQYHDLLLHEPMAILKADSKPYTLFTPFYKKSLSTALTAVDSFQGGHCRAITLSGTLTHDEIKKILVPLYNKQIHVNGGRAEGLQLLKKTAYLIQYKKTHDYLCDNTSFLSAHLKFGTLSVREVYSHIAEHTNHPEPLLRQLYWRDFFTHIVFHFPYVFGHSFKEKYKNITWDNNSALFDRWCNGMTGFPIVDAGMRQLNVTGFMHNRARMIVASFLTKDLHIDWRWGERYFAQKLVDYDPVVNNGNWQWTASTGADSQPYFRIFNPWLQQKKFDFDCIYIKKWIPELKQYDAAVIHTWYKKKVVSKEYPYPILDHSAEANKAKRYYK